MAGPWFAVHRSGDDWQELSGIWVSNGREDSKGKIELRVELEQAPHG